MPNNTKHALEKSLKKLLTEKPLKKITVKDITENCDMNRMTFYYHFQDINDLIEWIFDKEVEKILNDNKTYTTWHYGILDFFNSILKNKLIVSSVYTSLSRESIESYLYKLTYKILLDIVNDMSKNIVIKEEDKIFIIDFYKYALVGVILDWITKNMKETPENLVSKLLLLIDADITNGLNKFKIS